MKSDHNSGGINPHPDVVLVGGGIMSATLGVLLKQLDPGLSIQIVEALPRVALESSHAWNNAGTGHAALCELNYTAEDGAGKVDISKAVGINERFETSLHFWGYLVARGIIRAPSAFIRSVPHMSFVWGRENRDFLRRRQLAMAASPLFKTMEFSDDPAQIGQWAPLLMEGRPAGEPVAATRVAAGTDVNYGALTRLLIDHLVSLDGVGLALETRVDRLEHQKNGRWQVGLLDGQGRRQELSAEFCFIGAGGGALPLLQKSAIPEGRGYGGFPVSGQFLVCQNREIVERHAAKVYGKAAVGAPPMSVPHLDTRMIDGQKVLLFGPYAGFSPKFLKSGSNLDLLKSVRPDNLLPMLAAGRDNLPLTKYLVNECRKSHADRCESLREFFPGAQDEEWKLIVAGQRVQIIKKDPKRTGVLQFGTEVVAASDGSLAAVLGASPGASTAVSIMLELLEKCYPRSMASDAWKSTLAELVPACGRKLAAEPELLAKLRAQADARLGLVPTT